MALRIAALYLAGTLLLLLALGGALYLSTERALLDSRQSDLQTFASGDAAFLGSAVGSQGDLVAQAATIAQSLPRPAEGGVRIFSANGTLLAALPPESAGNRHPSRATISWLPTSLITLILTPGDEPGRIYAAVPIQDAGKAVIGVVEAEGTRADIDSILDRLRRAFAIAAGLAALFAVGGGLLLARWIARPVRRLEAVATAIAGGDLSRRATGLPGNEIGALGESFNRMAARLSGLLDEARGEQARLSALLAGLADGVLACGADGTLTLENPAAREMLGVPPDAPASTVQEAAAALGISALWRRAMGREPGAEHAGPAEAEIQAGGRVCLAVAVPIAEGGAVCVLRDITRLRELEQGRASVLRRLGHELRTPLTALRTVLANLADTAAPDDAPALATAEAEAARLSRLVEEIFVMSQGRAGTPLSTRPTDLSALAEAGCALFAARAGRLGVTLRGPETGAAPVVVRGDPDRLRQVLVNLLDNALRHTPPGGLVTVSTEAVEGEALLTVRDNGEGMDPVTSRWAFEPYYQGGSPHPAEIANETGQPGGIGSSGLGLAIVREIATAHGGSVSLESSPGMGTTVCVRLSLAM
ncbi:MAG: ATP-binding protein [Chloroflexia bacterium]